MRTRRERQRLLSSRDDSAAVHICPYISRAPATKAKETLYTQTQKGSTGWLLNKQAPFCVAFKLNQSFIFTHCLKYERKKRKFLIFTSFIYTSKGYVNLKKFIYIALKTYVAGGGANCSVPLISNRWENSLKRQVSQALSTDILARMGPVVIYSLHRI